MTEKVQCYVFFVKGLLNNVFKMVLVMFLNAFRLFCLVLKEEEGQSTKKKQIQNMNIKMK